MALWTELTPNSRVFFIEYDVLGFGPTNSMALPVPGGLAVLSPPSSPSPSHFAFFEDPEHPENKLAATIAPHSGHTVGLGPWNTRFPDVPIYAPASSIPVILEKVGKDLKQPTKPLEALQATILASGAGTGYKIVLREVFKSKNGSIAVLCLPSSDSGPSILYSDEYVATFILFFHASDSPRFQVRHELR